MSITNTSKPAPSMTNTARVVSYETWNSNTSTWGSETRTWNQMGAIITNSTRPTPSMTNTAKPA